MGIYDSHPYWDARVVRAFLRLGSERAARTQMLRWEVPEGPPGPNGEKRWAQQDVLDAADARPGRGHRTDIQRPNASYVAAIALAHGGDTVPRDHIRDEWMKRYPEDRDSKYPGAERGDWVSEGTYARVRVKDALRQLAKKAAITRSPTAITILDRDLLAAIAREMISLPETS